MPANLVVANQTLGDEQLIGHYCLWPRASPSRRSRRAKAPSRSKLAADRARIIDRRGRNIGVVAATRTLLTLVYYGRRDGEIRVLARGAA
jgi:hypothetical protein